VPADGRDCDAGPLAEGSDAEQDRIRNLFPGLELETEEPEEDEGDEEVEEMTQDDTALAVDDASAAEETGGDFYVEDAEQPLDHDVSGVELRSMLSSAFELELQLISSGDVQNVPVPAVANVEPITSQIQLTEPQPASSQVILHIR